MKRLLLALVLAGATTGPALADPTADLMHAMVNFGKMSSYHMEMTAKGQTVEADMMPPAKMHVTVHGFEIIKLDSDMYVKMGETWRKFNVPGMDQITGMYKGAIDSASHPTDDMVATDLGPKIVEGVPLHAYTMTDKQHPKAAATIYLDGGGNVARIEPTEGGVIKISKFNAPMSIVAPI